MSLLKQCLRVSATQLININNVPYFNIGTLKNNELLVQFRDLDGQSKNKDK